MWTTPLRAWTPSEFLFICAFQPPRSGFNPYYRQVIPIANVSATGIQFLCRSPLALGAVQCVIKKSRVWDGYLLVLCAEHMERSCSVLYSYCWLLAWLTVWIKGGNWLWKQKSFYPPVPRKSVCWIIACFQISPNRNREALCCVHASSPHAPPGGILVPCTSLVCMVMVQPASVKTLQWKWIAELRLAHAATRLLIFPTLHLVFTLLG